jgi:hypothetical protein
MKKVAALCATLLLAACGTADVEGPVDLAPPPSGASLSALQKFAQKVPAFVEPAPLIVVSQASTVIHELETNPYQFYTVSNGDGYQRATLVEDPIVTSWSHDCWSGTPLFPGSYQWSPCGTVQGPFHLLTTDEVLEKTRAMVMAIAGLEGYQMLWSAFEQDDELHDYQLWYADPDGRVYYWHWHVGLAAEESTP